MTGLNVGIVGGSVGGMAVATALTRKGFSATVFERSPGHLEERGGGIGIPLDVLEDFRERDLIDKDVNGVRGSERTWCVKEGDSKLGKILAHQAMAMDAQHWALMYQQMRDRADGAEYRPGAKVVRVEDRADGADIVLEDGSRHHFDLVVGADGYRSRTRLSILPGTAPTYAGYPAWRGVIEESAGIVTDVGPIIDSMQSVGTRNGHCLFYFVPGRNGEVTEGRRRVNWLWYDAGAGDDVMGVRRDDEGHALVNGAAPGELNETQLDYLHSIAKEQLPAWHADVVLRTPEPFMQPIFDLEPTSYVSGHIALVGDAASVARPHTGAGTTKAIHDAFALAESLSKHDTIAEALNVYDVERSAAGREMVQMGRMLGIEQVNEAPDWARFSPEELTEWLNTMTISKVYAWADARKA